MSGVDEDFYARTLSRLNDATSPLMNEAYGDPKQSMAIASALVQHLSAWICAMPDDEAVSAIAMGRHHLKRTWKHAFGGRGASDMTARGLSRIEAIQVVGCLEDLEMRARLAWMAVLSLAGEMTDERDHQALDLATATLMHACADARRWMEAAMEAGGDGG